MAAQNGNMVLVGASGKRYNIDVYFPDATGTLLTFSPTGLAASTGTTMLVAPEDVEINDVSLATAPTAVGVSLTANGGVINGGSLRYANQLTSVASRRVVGIRVPKGTLIGGTQF
jgi:hypothetical protein